ncbi:unnamed protein product [Phytophthora fragariaefolia]|uniref:Unnamed protein product n=1 Tax=Phytophthora fragariaefolia TaxID=1490495 RepID=A0A9W6XME1_9STRA|nr:unnamed protein product [Phytophthora fragariaefolia]
MYGGAIAVGHVDAWCAAAWTETLPSRVRERCSCRIEPVGELVVVVEAPGEGDDRDRVAHRALAPLVDKYSQQPVKQLLVVDLAVRRELPHLGAHLHEPEEPAGPGAHDDLGGVADDAAVELRAVGQDGVHLGADAKALDRATHVDALAEHGDLAAPDVGAREELVLEAELDEVDAHVALVHAPHGDGAEGLEPELGRDLARHAQLQLAAHGRERLDGQHEPRVRALGLRQLHQVALLDVREQVRVQHQQLAAAELGPVHHERQRVAVARVAPRAPHRQPAARSAKCDQLQPGRDPPLDMATLRYTVPEDNPVPQTLDSDSDRHGGNGYTAVAASPAAAASAAERPAPTAAAAAAVPSIQSGLSLTLHPRAMEGMVSKSEAYYATLTRGDPAYDMLTPSNDKFLTIRLRKRGWRTGTFLGMPSPATQRPFFANGDVVTLECNGLWLKASSLNKMLQWKAPSDDDRNKFVIRGLPLGKNLAPGDYFFLTSYKWKDKEIVRKDERPVGISSYNTNVHRCFLGLERIKTANQRLYLYAKLTQNAIKSLPRPDDPIDVNHLTISVMGTPMSTGSISFHEENHSRRKDSISDEIQLTNAKIEQMANIIGTDVSRDRLANFLDGAGGDVQVALEHYFMSISTPTQNAISSSAPPSLQIPVRDSATSLEEAQALTHAEAQANHDRRPLSQLILGIPSIAEPLPSPSTEPIPIPPHSTKTKHGVVVTPPRPPSVDVTSTFVGEPSPGMPPPVPSPIPSPIPPPVTPVSDSSMAAPVSAGGGASVPRITEGEEFVDTTDYTKHQEQMEQQLTQQEQQITQQEQQLRVSETLSEAEAERAEALTIQDFEMLSVLGKGSFGAVMLVRFKKDGRVFALKIIKKTNMDQADVQNAMEERQILQRIHHPYICGLVFAFQTNERLYLGMKYYAAGDLFYHLNMKGRLNVKDAKLYGAELVLAISYLHELNILYRDLKPSNVMIDSEGHIGVVDFGLSKQHIYGSSFGVKTLSGTAEYVAPEALAQSADGSRNYGKAYDWWSLGVVIVRAVLSTQSFSYFLTFLCCHICMQYEMLVGESPFYDENEHKMLSRIAYSEVVFPSDFPRDAYDLVKGLLIKDPKQRLGSERMGGVDAIKRCRFFRHIDWDKLLRREVKAHWTPKLSGETDTRYVDPEFIDEGPPSAVYDPSAETSNSLSKRFSQFSFNYNLG